MNLAIHLGPALITVLTMFLLVWTVAMVGRARHRFNVKAPATTGPVEFERAYRVQMNTLEATMMFLPCLWLAAIYSRMDVAVISGGVWVMARIWYAITYARGLNRGPAFTLSMGCNGLLLLAASIGVVRALLSAA